MCRRSGNGLLPVPFGAPLSGAPAPTAAELAAGRSPDPTTFPFPRLHRKKNQGEGTVNGLELQPALEQLPLVGVAGVVETRLHQSHAGPSATTTLISCYV